eukprot:8967138-Heterocapsa_arctica.AAC.1
MENSSPSDAHELWIDTAQLTRYLTINAGTKHATGYSPATLTMRIQSARQQARRNQKAKAKLCKLPCPSRLAKEVEETKKKQTADLN